MPYEFDINTGQYIDTSVVDFSNDAISTKPSAMSVSDALLLAKTGLESIKVNIIGEVSQVSDKPGYAAVYFSVKDKNSVLPCLMWKNRYKLMDNDLSVGDLIELRGRFSLYAAKGRMNFDVSSFSLAGEGKLRQLVAQREKKLRTLGLMDASKKKDVPFFCQKVGVITSPRGAVVHDIIRTINRRMPVTTIYFAGCAVEGLDAPKNIISAFDRLEKEDLDVIVLARGGGSYEDLMPFNDEELAFRIAKCSIPVVSGIGHEPDTTIADLVSDFRASTPTGAAECVSINLGEYIDKYSSDLIHSKKQIINLLLQAKRVLDDISKKPIFADPRLLFSKEFQSLDYYSSSLFKLGPSIINNFKSSYELLCAKLHERSPFTVMSRGYCIAKDSKGHVLSSVNNALVDSDIVLQLKDGELDCIVNKINKNA